MLKIMELMALIRKSGISLIFTLLSVAHSWGVQEFHFTPGQGDMTPVIREVLENADDLEIKLVFAKGTYRFAPDFATEKYCYITNHENGLKKVVFLFNGYKSIEIEGNGSEFIFHGQLLPFLFEGCNRVTARGFSIDWDIPFLFQGEVVAINPDEGWRDIKPFKDGYAWDLKGGRLLFPLVDGFSYSELGSTLAFEKDPKRVAHGAWDIDSRPQQIERREGGILRIHEVLKHYPPVGTILNSKGPTGENRHAPAIHVKSSSNILLEDIVIHHALGMGFLMERTDTATLRNCGVFVRDGSDRVVSTTADATHFCNCKGDIVVEDCRFENMLDDGTNVHGTYVEVAEILDERTLRYELKHFQQLGFEFAGLGDTIWFIQAPSPQRVSQNIVTHVRVINERFAELRFRNELPIDLRKGDLLENKTWNPTFTMRRCTIQNHRARNVVLKTPGKIVVEDNDLSSMMSSIFFRGESYYWFESGVVQDVLIQNNRFRHCAYSGMEHAVLNVTPRLGSRFDKDEPYDCNIRFINNSIETFDSRIVWADRVNSLLVADNKIIKTDNAVPLYPNAAAFDFKNCRSVCVRDNEIKGSYNKLIRVDKVTQSTMRFYSNEDSE